MPLPNLARCFITPNQKALLLQNTGGQMVLWYGIPSCIHSDKGCSFDNEIMSHLYAMHGVQQSTTTPHNLHGNAPQKD